MQARDPADILVTTPESLYLLLGSEARQALRSVETVIVDEVHALAPTKRGVHLAVSLERLSALTPHDPQRVGLSATAHPLGEVARYLGGDRNVTIVDAGMPPQLDIRVVLTSPAQEAAGTQHHGVGAGTFEGANRGRHGYEGDSSTKTRKAGCGLHPGSRRTRLVPSRRGRSVCAACNLPLFPLCP
jgi:Lhr-like helicase